MKIGVVSVTYNSEKVLADFFSSLSAQTHSNFKTIYIDNASSDNSVELIKAHLDSNQILVENKTNVGVAAANNQGIKLAMEQDCDFILLMNNDTKFEPALFEKLIDGYHRYKSSVIVPKMKYYDNQDEIWFAGGFYNPWKAKLNYHRGQGELDKGQYNSDDVIEYAPTCCALIHKTVFEDVGLMDEKFFVYFDDTDFFYRIKLNNKHEVRYIHNIEFFHKIGSLTKSRTAKGSQFYSPFFIKQNSKNHVYFLKKQKDLLSYLMIIYLWFYLMFRFFFSRNFNKNWQVLSLIQTSYFKGLKM
ncbi:MAG: glycosyltransferase family 2 protein [Flavobacteriales bacterium]